MKRPMLGCIAHDFAGATDLLAMGPAFASLKWVTAGMAGITETGPE